MIVPASNTAVSFRAIRLLTARPSGLTYQRSGLTFWCKRMAFRPNVGTVWISKANAASVGAVYSPSGHHLYIISSHRGVSNQHAIHTLDLI